MENSRTRGIYDLTATPLADPEKAYFGSDPARYAERSSLDGLTTTKIPVMIVTAELDPPGFNKQFDLLKEARCKAENGCVRALLLPQHSHMSEVYSINTADTRLTDQMPIECPLASRSGNTRRAAATTPSAFDPAYGQHGTNKR